MILSLPLSGMLFLLFVLIVLSRIMIGIVFMIMLMIFTMMKNIVKYVILAFDLNFTRHGGYDGRKDNNYADFSSLSCCWCAAFSTSSHCGID